MNARERMRTAMRLGIPDRVPVMCQLSLGHYFLHSGIDNLDIWHNSEAYSKALVRLQQQYRFDGILVNMPGHPDNWRTHVDKIERRDREQWISWKNGAITVVPDDDNPHVFDPDGRRHFPDLAKIDPEQLFYIDPHDWSGIVYPYTYHFEAEPRSFGSEFFPPWITNALRKVRQKAGPTVSVHAEIFSPFSQLMELLNFQEGLMALITDEQKVLACLDALTRGAIELGKLQGAADIDAILISCAFSGGGFISPDHYARFVLPFNRRIVTGIKSAHPDLPIYVHTCGAIGDRLDLIMESSVDGIDTLDPPPLGTITLENAVKKLKGKVFIKGNLDPVNSLLMGDEATFEKDVRHRLEIGMPGGGYILSSACSVSPGVSPRRLERLAELRDQYGVYR